MARKSRELWTALIAVLSITGLYLLVVVRQGSIPAASDFFGHSLGILGFGMMLMTETLYSLRKRSRSARWGRMADWLQFHIFTGIVGSFLVLLHSSWKFNGLAGVLMLLTIIIVISGFIGRYIYTAVPRTVDGAILTREELQASIAKLEGELQRLMISRPQSSAMTDWLESLQKSTPRSDIRLIFGRGLDGLIFRSRAWFALRRFDPEARDLARQFFHISRRRQALARQEASLALARRTLSLWHAIHIPIGVALFTIAFIHIGAAVYYATLLR